MMIRSYSFEEYLRILEGFHGYPAPGALIGGYMVEEAYLHLPAGGFYDAISETTKCLPDAIQLLTPCTIGNGWLTIMNYGRFALTLYEKQTGKGIRVFIDTPKLDRWPEIKKWFLKLVPKKDQDTEKLRGEIRAAGTGIMGATEVTVVPRLLGKKKKGEITICPSCNEAYPRTDGDRCLACRGDTIYESVR